jgi:hypothetical protein
VTHHLLARISPSNKRSWSADRHSCRHTVGQWRIAKRIMVKAPVFIVGCGRSGTSLLFDLLSQHPQLARTTGYPDGEDHAGWIEHGRCAMAGIGNAGSDRYGTGINGTNYCLHLTEEDATPEIVSAMHRYYSDTVLSGDATRRVINKQPHLSNKLRYLLRIFPDARVIHIVRDCAPVVASWAAIMEQHPSLVAYWPDEPFPCFWLFPKPGTGTTAASGLRRHGRFFPGSSAELWIEYWCKVNTGIAPQMVAHDRQLCGVRYEDLISEPERVLAGLSRFCALDAFDFDTSTIDAKMARRHATRLAAALRQDIDTRTREIRARFGYVETVQ